MFASPELELELEEELELELEEELDDELELDEELDELLLEEDDEPLLLPPCPPQAESTSPRLAQPRIFTEFRNNRLNEKFRDIA